MHRALRRVWCGKPSYGLYASHRLRAEVHRISLHSVKQISIYSATELDESTYALMKYPIMNLKLDPSSRKQIQRRSRLKFSLLPGHKLLADQPWIRRPQLLLSRLLTVLSREVATKAHA